MAQDFKIPSGNAKGTLLEQAETKDIEYWLGRKRTRLVQEPNHQYVAGDRLWIAAAEAVLAKRGGGAPAKPAASTAITQQSQPAAQSIVMAEPNAMALVGAFGDPRLITAALMQAQQHYHVVTPAMSVGGIPEGCEIYTALVVIDPYGTEVYSITGNRKNPQDGDTVGLDKVALRKIGNALGISWRHSQRKDDGRHPHYCAWEACAIYQQFDGQPCQIFGNVDIDTRAPDGPAYVEIVTKAKRREGDNDGGESQLLELRKFLVRQCESKAMNKCISEVGLHRSYKRSELTKPFLVARLAVTGRTDDPELKREFARMHYQQRLNGTAALYGGAPAALPAPAPVERSYSYDSQGYEPTQPMAFSIPTSAPQQLTVQGAAADAEPEPDPHDDTPAASTQASPAPAGAQQTLAGTGASAQPVAAAAGSKF